MRKIRTVFLSDIHLGSRHASTEKLLEFLSSIKHHKPESIYLVGDIIDGWKLKRNWYWDDNASLVIRKLLGFVRRGTKIYYATGNHDEFLRVFIKDFQILEFGAVQIGNEFIHTTATGEKLLVVHGDVFDVVVKNARWLSLIGDIGYELLLQTNSYVHQVRNKLGLKHWSFSKAIKANVKQACNFISSFEEYLTAYAKKRGCSGIVCGHIHHCRSDKINGINYYNCGDWVESRTAIVEYDDGEISLIETD